MNDMEPKDQRRVDEILKRHDYNPTDEKLWAMVDEVWSDGYEQASLDGVAVKFEDAKAGIKRILDELRMKS
jgi:methionine salvage enolase-phosphatase E1